MASNSSDSARERDHETSANHAKDDSPAASSPGRADVDPIFVSPAAAGPAGALLEGHVGAQYLLPLLSGSEARGLPGVIVTRVAFQQAGTGYPMDDVVVTGHDRRGRPATLEIQAKRTIAFSASDAVFAKVVSLACPAMRKPEFLTTRYELAVAIARTSTTIEQHVQETLRWAREYPDPVTFFARLSQQGVAHESMRKFVTALRGHMAAAGAPHEDADVWRFLSRFQVLAFDCEQVGSICEQLARERCAMLLAPQEAGRAAELWDSLQRLALETDAKGGYLDNAALVNRLTSERSYRFAGDRRLSGARAQLAENASNALAKIDTRIGGVTIDRTQHVNAALSALEHGRYLVIQGTGGVGKSGVLKQMVERVRAESRVIVAAPNRIPGGGWGALRAQLGCEASARELLTDLAGDGGGTLFIDGLDRFDKADEQETLVDLINTAARVPGFRVVVTARLDFDADAASWLPLSALEQLGRAPPHLIPELTDEEVAYLREADTALAALLAPGHRAKAVLRNLYRLSRLVRSVQADEGSPFSEAQMARQWWETGDGASGGPMRLERRRLLRDLAVHFIASSSPMNANAVPAQAVTELVEAGSLRAVSTMLVEPAHDVLGDWAIGCLLFEEPAHIDSMDLAKRAPMRLVRGVELAARMHAESADGLTGWQALLDRVNGPTANGSWKRAILLALARSERASDTLENCGPALGADNAGLFGDLVRAVITEDSQPATPVWAMAGIDTSKLAGDLVAPSGPAWLNLILWSYGLGDKVPGSAVPLLVDLYSRWCTAMLGKDPLSPHLVGRLYSWLTEVEARNHPAVTGFHARVAEMESSGLSMTAAQEDDLRMAFLQWCVLRPDDASAYLAKWQVHPHRHVMFRRLLAFLGSAAQAAPRAVADLFMVALPEGDDDSDRGGRHEPFSGWSTEYFPASPARPPFLALLEAKPEEGLRLIRAVVSHVIQYWTGDQSPAKDGIDVILASGPRSFPWRWSYAMSRANDSQVSASALMAMEAWAHRRIEGGEQPSAVIEDILGPPGSPAAYLLVAIDVMLSHWPATRECLAPFAASAELLALDRERYAHDYIADPATNFWVRPEPVSSARLQDLLARRSRQLALDDVLADYGVNGPASMRDAMRQRLRDDSKRLGPPQEGTSPTDAAFAAMSALNKLDPANYSTIEGQEGARIAYHYPADEARLRAILQARAERGNAAVALRVTMMRALTSSPCGQEHLAQGVEWAAHQSSKSAPADDDDREWIDRTRLTIAALVWRDGPPPMIAQYGDWAQALLEEAAEGDAAARGTIPQLQYNPRAIAAVGLLALYRADPQPTILEHLLRLAGRYDTRMADVLRVELKAQRAVSSAMLEALMRLGLSSAIYALTKRDPVDWNTVEDYRAFRDAQELARRDVERERLLAMVAAERQWLSGEGDEPGWPVLPDPKAPKARAGISIGTPRVPPAKRKKPATKRELALDSGAAAAWVSLAKDLWYRDAPELLLGLVEHCWGWTAAANGVGCDKDEEPSEHAHEWNDAYFAAATAAVTTSNDANVSDLVFQKIAQLPQERFLDASTAVLHELDSLWLNERRVSVSAVLAVREAVASRITEFWTWRRLTLERSTSAEVHLTGCVAALFLGQYEFGKGPRCYVLRSGAERAEAMLPLLTQLAVEAAPSAFVARAMLGLLEAQPHVRQLPFLADVVNAWWRAQEANTEFWNDCSIGLRLVAWVEKAILNDGVPVEILDSGDLASIVDVLLRSGTPLAKSLDEKIAASRYRSSN
ncbi:hypothetical protein [Cupriavidus pauculus]|uniref:hypothetical protein n=1 Tax=Cupriavidus pauculus TaxID=82633 RepID=UPI0030F6B8D3